MIPQNCRRCLQVCYTTCPTYLTHRATRPEWWRIWGMMSPKGWRRY
jgi:hypothetical protein